MKIGDFMGSIINPNINRVANFSPGELYWLTAWVEEQKQNAYWEIVSYDQLEWCEMRILIKTLVSYINKTILQSGEEYSFFFKFCALISSMDQVKTMSISTDFVLGYVNELINLREESTEVPEAK